MDMPIYRKYDLTLSSILLVKGQDENLIFFGCQSLEKKTFHLI